MTTLDTATSANVGERTTNAEGVFPLCAGDRILVIVSLTICDVDGCSLCLATSIQRITDSQASKGGNPLTNNFATLLGDAKGQRNLFTVEKMGFN